MREAHRHPRSCGLSCRKFCLQDQAGRAAPFKRDALRWRFTVTDDGSIPLDGAAPLLLQWDETGPSHPASRMTDLGLRMDALSIDTPHANELNALLETLGLQELPEIRQSQTTKINAVFSTPADRGKHDR